MLQTSSVFLLVPWLLGGKNVTRGNNFPINGPILLEKAHEFAKAFNYNDFTASNYGCSNGCSSLACTILYIVKTHPLLIFFSKFGRNNLNSYNSKTHVIRTNFESRWELELYEFNCIRRTKVASDKCLTSLVKKFSCLNKFFSP